MDRRPALGKGLSALIPESPPEAPGGITELDIDLIAPNEDQPRLQMDDDKLEDLAKSIRANGIIQPLLVQHTDDGYRIIAGERRWRAAQRAGLLKVPVVIREIKVSARGVADSLIGLLDSGTGFALLAQQNSSTNPEGGGLYGPFSRSGDVSLFDAASLLGVGEYSSVLPTSKNSFSIIQLVEPASATPIDVDRVYVQIESLLIKEGQDEAKSIGVGGLLNKYTIIKNSDLLF